MTAENFIKSVSQLCPGIGEYEKFSLPFEVVQNEIQSYHLGQKRISSNQYKDKFLGLLFNYDLSGFVLTPFTFYKTPVTIHEFVAFAEVEVEKLVIHRDTCEVFCLDEDDSTILFNVAKDGSCFLEVLFHYVEKYTLMRKGTGYDECLLAQELRDLSGEESSIDFYKWVLGCCNV